MTTELDSILSGGGEALPSADQTTTTQTDAGQGGQPPQDPPQADASSPPDEGGDKGQSTVPVAALHAERQKVKRYTEEVAEFRRTNEALQRQVSELLQRIPAPQQQQQPKPDFFENPDAAVGSTVQQLLQQMVAPQINELSQAQMFNSQLIAGQVYGADKVKAAEDAFVQAVQAKSLDPADYQKVVNSPNRYAAAVEWHQRQMALAEIGNDPAAYKAKVEAEILAKHGLKPEGGTEGGNAPAAPPSPVMPTNIAGARNVGSRSGPAWGGPQKLNDIFKR